jgi:hypothetical protein
MTGQSTYLTIPNYTVSHARWQASLRNWRHQATRYHIPDDVIFIFRLRNARMSIVCRSCSNEGFREMSDYHGDDYEAQSSGMRRRENW